MERLLCLIFLLSLNASAEVYRWTDADGKVHFGDKKSGATAENITEKVKTTNVDTSTSEHQKLESIFRKENEADREYKSQQQNGNQLEQAKTKRCIEAKDYLNKISGRVQFLDANGKPIHVSETERQEHVKKWQQAIKENCPN